MAGDIRDQLRRDHETALAELEALRAETEPARCLAMLEKMRRAWVIHALAEETVVYRALEGVGEETQGMSRADERFVEHERVEGLFDKLSRNAPRTLEWDARLEVVRGLVMRHIQTEHDEVCPGLERRFKPEELVELGRRFEMARDKLTFLEELKAA